MEEVDAAEWEAAWGGARQTRALELSKQQCAVTITASWPSTTKSGLHT
jgi:hypothetical protein